MTATIEKNATELVEKGTGATIGEVYRLFHSLPIQFKGMDENRRTNLKITGAEPSLEDWYHLDVASC